jgi:hypothetical protein
MFFVTAVVSVILTGNYTATALFLCAGLFFPYLETFSL